ncbi:MAG: hypothetical protein ACK4MR_03740, partial [Erythrobacter cryptus]
RIGVASAAQETVFRERKLTLEKRIRILVFIGNIQKVGAFVAPKFTRMNYRNPAETWQSQRLWAFGGSACSLRSPSNRASPVAEPFVRVLTHLCLEIDYRPAFSDVTQHWRCIENRRTLL